MTQQEAIEQREKLLARQRKLNHAIKILRSDTFEPTPCIDATIRDYEEKVKAIDQQIERLANQLEESIRRNRAAQQAEMSTTDLKNIVDVLSRVQRFVAAKPNASTEELLLRFMTGRI